MGWLGWWKRNTHENHRLREWRATWSAAAESPTRETAADLRQRLTGLGLDTDEFEIEREMLEGLEELVELNDVMSRSGPAAIPTGH
jgi:hypothetical protein